MDVVVSIKNETTLTPYLSVVQLNNAQWTFPQELTVNQPIAGGGRIAGMFDGTVPFTAVINIHYGYLAPGPGGADVQLDLNGILLDGKPTLGVAHNINPPTALPNTDVSVVVEEGNHIVMLTVAA